MKTHSLSVPYLLLGVAIMLAACNAGDKKLANDLPALPFDEALKPFYFGVASGDPTSTGVLLWTCVVPEYKVPSVEVNWEIAEDEAFENIVKSGTSSTDSANFHSLTLPVEGLKPNSYYFYRFKALDATSITGRTKTAPSADADSLKFAVVSCSNYEWGYFNAYGNIGRRNDLDAVIHLGDYIYEYGTGRYGDTTIGRFNMPPHEIITLTDYRTRYALYRLDKDLMKAHQMHPFITIWDDHEIANDAYKGGAQNHSPDTEGPYEQRKQVASKVYYEWLPVRKDNNKLYRSLKYGNLAEIFMLDERLEGRDGPFKDKTDPGYASDERSMLGKEQFAWLAGQLTSSETIWKVLGNQVIFAGLDRGPVFPNSPKNLDSWDGFPAERQRLIDHIKNNEIANVVILTGDTHSSWAFEVTDRPTNLKEYQPGKSMAVAVEFGTPSINSSNYSESTSIDTVRMVEQLYMNPAANPHLKYAELESHGYLTLTLTPEEAISRWYYVNTLREPSTEERLAKEFSVKKGSAAIE